MITAITTIAIITTIILSQGTDLEERESQPGLDEGSGLGGQ